jgi:hypothetical protein
MTDIASSIATAITLAQRLREISNNIKDAEFKNLLADLSLELADVKLKLAGVLEENIDLKNQIQKLKNVDGEPCPRCRKRGWDIVDSRPDPMMGEVGAVRRTYKCSICGFSEAKVVIP